MSILDRVVATFGEVKESGTEIYEVALEKKAISSSDEELSKRGVDRGALEEGEYEEIVAEKMAELREAHKGMLKGAAIVLGLDFLL